MLTFSIPLSLRASASQFGGGVTWVVPLEHLGSVPFAAQNAFLQSVVLSQSFCEQSFTGGGGLLFGFGLVTATFSHLDFATSSAASAPPAARASPMSLTILSHSSLSFIARALSR